MWLHNYILHTNILPHMQAYNKDIHYPKHIIMTPGRSRKFWWRQEIPGLNCTADQRESVLPFSLSVTENYFLDEDKDANITTTSGIVSLYVAKTKYPARE